jgi:ABC-type transporter Mla subunit MlaD
VYDNQQRIARTALALRDETAKFAQQNRQWKATIAHAQEVLKEVGDLENYMEAVKQETIAVASQLRQPPPSSSSEVSIEA